MGIPIHLHRQLQNSKFQNVKQIRWCTSVSAGAKAVILVCKQGWTPPCWCVSSASLIISSRFLSYLSCLQKVQEKTTSLHVYIVQTRS